MAKFLQRITMVDLTGRQAPTRIYKAKRKKRKVSRWLKPLERRDRRLGEAMKAFGGEIVKRHKRSGRKRRNGWLRDGNVNVFKAHRKAVKKLRKW